MRVVFRNPEKKPEMKVVTGALMGASVGALLGGLVTHRVNNSRASETALIPLQQERAPSPQLPETAFTPPAPADMLAVVVPASTRSHVDAVLMICSVAPTAARTALIEAVNRLCFLLHEVMQPAWVPDVLAQSEAVYMRQDAAATIADVLDTCIDNNSSDLYIEQVTAAKNRLLEELQATMSQIIAVSRAGLLRERNAL